MPIFEFSFMDDSGGVAMFVFASIIDDLRTEKKDL
jgi:hypothetical protein